MDHLCSLIRGFPISIWGAFVLVLDCWWPQKNSGGCGELAPAGLLSGPTWGVCDLQRVGTDRSTAAWADRHSFTWNSLGILVGISCALSHRHMPLPTAQKSPYSSICTVLYFWHGNSFVMNVSFLLCFHDFGWRVKRGVLSFSLGINPLLMKHLLTTEALKETFCLRCWDLTCSIYHNTLPQFTRDLAVQTNCTKLFAFWRLWWLKLRLTDWCLVDYIFLYLYCLNVVWVSLIKI